MKITKFVFVNLAGAIVLCAAGHAPGDVVTQWNFNSPVDDDTTSTGTLTPNIGAGTASLVGGVTSPGFSAGGTTGAAPSSSSDPAFASGDNSGWQTTTYAAQGAENGLRGVGFALSTVGYDNLLITWDQRHSNTSSRFAQFQYSLDGSNFTSAGLAGNGLFEATLGGDVWYNSRTVDLSSIVGAANNANFAFRVVAVFDPALGNAYSASTAASSYAATGTWRFDMVTVNGTLIPAPGALALLAMAGMIGTRRSRRQA